VTTRASRPASARAFAAALAATVAGCDRSPAAPESLVAAAGRYALVVVGGRPLPFVLSEYDGYRYVLLADTLVLAADGRYQRSTTVQAVEAGRDTTYGHAGSGRYALAGDRLTFPVPPCPPNALCAAPPTGMLRGSTLLLAYEYGPSPVYLFKRLAR
jgi:hypothetical protein